MIQDHIARNVNLLLIVVINTYLCGKKISTYRIFQFIYGTNALKNGITTLMITYLD